MDNLKNECLEMFSVDFCELVQFSKVLFEFNLFYFEFVLELSWFL